MWQPFFLYEKWMFCSKCLVWFGFIWTWWRICVLFCAFQDYMFLWNWCFVVYKILWLCFFCVFFCFYLLANWYVSIFGVWSFWLASWYESFTWLLSPLNFFLYWLIMSCQQDIHLHERCWNFDMVIDYLKLYLINDFNFLSFILQV